MFFLQIIGIESKLKRNWIGTSQNLYKFNSQKVMPPHIDSRWFIFYCYTIKALQSVGQLLIEERSFMPHNSFLISFCDKICQGFFLQKRMNLQKSKK